MIIEESKLALERKKDIGKLKRQLAALKKELKSPRNLFPLGSIVMLYRDTDSGKQRVLASIDNYLDSETEWLARTRNGQSIKVRVKGLKLASITEVALSYSMVSLFPT